MTSSEYRSMLDSLTAELDRATKDLSAAMRRRDSLQQAVRGLTAYIETQNGSSPTKVELPGMPKERDDAEMDFSTPLRGKEAAWSVLRARPRQKTSIQEILTELEKRGIAPESDDPASVLSVTMRRLMQDRPEVKRLAPGLFVYRPRAETIATSEGAG